MRALFAIIFIAILAAAGWFLRDLWLPPGEVPASGRASDSTTSDPSRTTGNTGAAPGAQSASATPDASASPAAVREQAEKYVQTLTEPEPEPVRVERADHFVTGEQVLSLVPETAVETTTVASLQADSTLTLDTPITVVREVEQVERLSPEKLIARSGGKLDTAVQVLVRDEVQEITVREVLRRASESPDTPIDVVTRSEYFEQTTPRELAAQATTGVNEPVKVLRQGHGLESATLAELMRTQAVDADSLFYVRTVRPDDSQGIWGIVQQGIIENFARGMAIRRGREINTYQVDIPRDADEPQENASSFLGRLIFEKARESYVFNFERSRMGRNPDRIYPGQEIVIINFSSEELIQIYEHFVQRSG